ncbi:hypothetical protein H9P43_008632 [Blastocladiella emersonii ATCC 22665]|nr:hypothetical protein H9P43_008632 [Blastocladiella emersonii ATCC 22665]
MSAEPAAVQQLTPIAATADAAAASVTVDDEAIARLLQQEFDDEAREAAALAAAATAAAPTGNGYPGQEYYTPSFPEQLPSTTEPQPPAFGIQEARDAVRSKLTDLLTFIKTEAQRAGQSSAVTSPTSPSATGAPERSVSETPTSAAVPHSPPQAFDFAKFLEQMRDRRALPLTKYFRSFLREFTKRKWTVNEQVKIVHDFLDFMAVQLAKNELYANASDDDLENAKEGMEKLLMNKLHPFTFSPSTSDDGVRDEVLFKKTSILQWIELKHLDVHIAPETAGPFLRVAQKELLKMNDYKAPRDKLICILNACKLIFGLLKQVHAQETADSFLPLLIFVVLQANPPHLHSNIQYINRFRNPAKLQSEAGYYLTNLMGAVSFIESIDHSVLSIAKDEFDARIEQRMRELEEKEAEARAARALAKLDTSSSDAAAPAASLVGPQQLEQLEQLAANVKKPIELVSRWFAQATQSLTSASSSPSTPSTASPATPTAAAAADCNTAAAVSAEMQPVDLSHLSMEERAMMTDYELQLAIAMSISLEEERLEWEKVPEDMLGGDAGLAAAAAAAAASGPTTAVVNDLIDLDGEFEGFSLQESASGAKPTATVTAANLLV